MSDKMPVTEYHIVAINSEHVSVIVRESGKDDKPLVYPNDYLTRETLVRARNKYPQAVKITLDVDIPKAVIQQYSWNVGEVTK